MLVRDLGCRQGVKSGSSSENGHTTFENTRVEQPLAGESRKSLVWVPCFYLVARFLMHNINARGHSLCTRTIRPLFSPFKYFPANSLQASWFYSHHCYFNVKAMIEIFMFLFLCQKK
jgi:hypothetical protein